MTIMVRAIGVVREMSLKERGCCQCELGSWGSGRMRSWLLREVCESVAPWVAIKIWEMTVALLLICHFCHIYIRYLFGDFGHFEEAKNIWNDKYGIIKDKIWNPFDILVKIRIFWRFQIRGQTDSSSCPWWVIFVGTILKYVRKNPNLVPNSGPPPYHPVLFHPPPFFN